MRHLLFIFALLIVVLQFQLWIGDNSVRTLNSLKGEVSQQKSINLALEERNKKLEIEIVDLKTGVEAIEERARSELGMIEKGETFFLIVE
jgi:cell division protein FtsB|tara:strand:- start:246 stop:515 length:270 start_codon:yes stop_codon:yes gene_type:complete